MVTEIDLLRKEIPRLEKKFGASNPFVRLLKTQLAFLQNQNGQQPQGDLLQSGFENIKSSETRKGNGASNKHL